MKNNETVMDIARREQEPVLCLCETVNHSLLQTPLSEWSKEIIEKQQKNRTIFFIVFPMDMLLYMTDIYTYTIFNGCVKCKITFLC